MYKKKWTGVKDVGRRIEKILINNQGTKEGEYGEGGSKTVPLN